MKVAISSQSLMTFEVYSPVVDGNTQTVSWILKDTGTGNIDPHTGGDIDLYSKVAYRPGSAIRNLVDTAGVNMFSVDGSAYQMFVVSIMPLVGLDGRVDGYMHRLSTRLRESTIQVLGASL